MDDPYTTDLQVRSRDLDALGHVNHTVYVVYMQQARHEYLREVVGPRLGLNPVVAHLEVDYEDEVRGEDAVTVAVEPTEFGETSFALAYEVRTDDGVAATGESVQVTVDSDAGEPRPVPGAWIERMDEYHGSP